MPVSSRCTLILLAACVLAGGCATATRGASTASFAAGGAIFGPGGAAVGAVLGWLLGEAAVDELDLDQGKSAAQEVAEVGGGSLLDSLLGDFRDFLIFGVEALLVIFVARYLWKRYKANEAKWAHKDEKDSAIISELRASVESLKDRNRAN